MKISFMTFACPDWSLDQVIDAAGRHGFNGVEFRCDANHRHGVEATSTPEERQRMRSKLEHAGVEACCLATSLQFVTDHAVREAPPRIQLAADLGCPALRVFCGRVPDILTRREAFDHCARNLMETTELATQADIQLWLETHDSISKAADCASIIQTANHPALGINYDNMHPFRMGEPLDATFASLGTLVKHTHMHNSVASTDSVIVKRLDEGDLPMDETFQFLVNSGFTGYLSGEWFDDMYGQTPDDALAAYHQDMTALCGRNGISLDPI